MEVVKLVENDDGSATITFDMDEAEHSMLIQYAITNLIKESIRKEAKSAECECAENSK